MRPKLWACILLTVLLAPISGVLLLWALKFTFKAFDLKWLGIWLGLPAFGLIGILVYVWVMRARVMKEERKNLY